MVEEYFHTEMKMVADMEGASKDCLEAAAVQIKEETFDAIGRLAGFNLVYHLTGKNRLSIDQEGAESALPGAVGMGAGAAAGAAAGMAAGEATATTGSNVNVTASDPSNGAYGNVENAERVYNALINAGFSPVAASAFLGNFYAENGIEPGTSIPEKGSCGIAQWIGDRKTRLVEYANERGLDPTDLQTQIDYLIEVDIPINLDSDAVNRLNSMTDPQLAGDYICTYFERPQNFTSHDKW